MKFAVYSVCLITILLIFFAIIDHKDYNSPQNTGIQEENAVKTKKTVMNPATPAEKTTKTKPVETKDVTETESAGTKIITETESKGTTAKPVETKSMTPELSSVTKEAAKNNISISEEKSAPAAIPTATQEEAEKLNKEAIEYANEEKEKREPFFRLYQNIKLRTFCFEGTVRATSSIPDPAENDYDNCLYAVFVEIDSLLSDVPSDTGIARGVLVNVPIMKDKTILQGNKFSFGDKVLCTCTEYDSMPQGIQEIQLSDDIQSFDHQQYYPIEIKKISAFRAGGNKNFSKREISILPIQTYPKEEKAAKLRQERIQTEIEHIEEQLKKHGGTFEKWKEEYKSIEGKYEKLSAQKYKGWINDSYFAAEPGTPVYKTKEYIDGILPYKKHLEKNNIDLIVVRVPTKGEFAQSVLCSDDFQDNPTWIEHYYNCLKNDIEIIDPMYEMWKQRFNFPLFYFYNIPEEQHPFEGQAFVSAELISTVLKRYQYQESKQEIILVDSTFQSNQSKYFWPNGNEKYDSTKNIVFKQVNRNDEPIGNLSSSSGSPFLFLSNSYFWYPHRSLGASVPGYTAYFLQAIPDWFYQDGTHNPMIRNLIAKPELLNFRKAVIMVGHPNDWKEFPPLPKYIQEQATRITLEKTLNAFSDELTLHKNDSFMYSMDENGSMSFVSKDISASQTTNQFDIDLRIPCIDGKKTCMIRVNFNKASYINVKIIPDKSDNTIDTCTIAPGNGQKADLFVPLSDSSRNVKILFQTPFKLKEKEFIIKDIELWYY